VLLLPAVAFSQASEIIEVTRLRDEGKVFFDQAANVDLSRSERNKNLKQGYDLLTKAFKILDKWCDEHQDDAEKYEDLMVEIHQMRYFIRKEAPINLLNQDESNVRKGKPPDWPDKPPEDPKPARPEPGGVEPGGDVPPRPEPAPQRNPIGEHLEFAQKYEREHPYDQAHARDLYLDILEHAEPGTEAYEKALARVSVLNSTLKEAYRKIRNEDMDTLKMAGSEERRIVHSLSKDLGSKQRDVRLRSAEYLGLLGSGDGARHLVKLLSKEKDVDIRDMILGSLQKIGGSKTCAELGKLGTSRKEDVQLEALQVLETLAGRSSVEGRYASEAMGKFVTAKSDAAADQAINALAAMGSDGIYGLMVASGVKNHERKLAVIHALGDTGDGRAAGGLGPYLMRGTIGKTQAYCDAAEEACKKIGKDVTPHLARFLGNPRAAVYVRYVLREITGKHFKTPASAIAWYKRQ
jgi:HEAT repeat protein